MNAVRDCVRCEQQLAAYCRKCVDVEREELNRLRRLVPTGSYTLNVAHEEEIQRLKDAGEVLVRSLERMTKERDEARAELAFIQAEYTEANESDLTRDALCLRAATLRLLADKAAAEQGLAQRRMMEAQAARDKARAKAADYERDWYAAKSEFDSAMAKRREALCAAAKRELEALAELDEARATLRLIAKLRVTHGCDCSEMSANFDCERCFACKVSDALEEPVAP